MSIEPSSASKPVMRDNESISREIPWINTQGSASGLKDGHFSSFWDNAVNSSQKLLDRQTDQNEDDGEESSRRDYESRNANDKANSLSSIPGFAGTSLTRARFSLQNGIFSDLPEFRTTDRSVFKAEPALESELKPKAEKRDSAPPESIGQTPTNGLNETDERLEDDEGEKEEKNADRPEAKPRLRVGQNTNLHLLNIDKQGVTNQITPVGTEDAKKVAHMSTSSTAPEVKSVSQKTETSAGVLPGGDSQRRIEPMQEVSGKQIEGTSKLGMSPVGQQVAQAAPNGQIVQTDPTRQTEVAKPTVPSAEKPVDSDTSKIRPLSTQQHDTVNRTSNANVESSDTNRLTPIAKDAIKSDANKAAKADDSLLIDAEKSKGEITSALNRANRSSRAAYHASPNALQNAAPQSSAHDTQSNSDSTKSRGAESTDTNKELAGKGSQATGLENRNPNANPLRNQNAVRGAPEAIKPIIQAAHNGEGANVASIAKQVHHSTDPQGLAGRDARPVAASNTNRSNASSSNVSFSSINGIQTAGASRVNTSAQSHSQNFDTSGKNEMSQALKAATQTTRAEKPAGDTSQAFDTQTTQSASDKKSVAAAKARMTSYASKTASEIKEIFTTVTKGLERMTNLKQNTMTIRINFDQGGMLSLKLSMDNGQVNTSMQTDLPGLESMIKSNWSELASDWSQKGLKLNMPQFTQTDGSNETFESLDQKEGRSQNANQANQRGSRGSANTNSDPANGSRDSSQENEVSADGSEGDSVDTNNEQELQTYA